MSRSEAVLRNKDFLAGLLFLTMAGLVAYGAARLPMGTTVRMGSGYFPIVLAGLLALFGAITLLKGVREAAGDQDASADRMVRSFALSRVAIVTASVLFFVIALEPLGFLATIFGTTLIATFGNRRVQPIASVVLAAGVAAASWVLFAMLLNLPFQALGSWLIGW